MARKPEQSGLPCKGKAMNDDNEFSDLDDPAFLAERRRVREELENGPGTAVSASLAARYWKLDQEFLRRARSAWT